LSNILLIFHATGLLLRPSGQKAAWSENGESATGGMFPSWLGFQPTLGGSPFDSVEPVNRRSRPK
jgi:hypothetical protein